MSKRVCITYSVMRESCCVHQQKNGIIHCYLTFMSLLTKTLIGALIPFIAVILIVIAQQSPHADVIAALDIGVEHASPLTLAVTVTRNDRMRMVDIVNDKSESISLSVPDDWIRGEVRNAPVASILSEAPSFGYVRWTVPKDASVSFRTDAPFDRLNIHNPSGVLLKIRFTSVDLLQNTGEHNVFLVKEGAVKVP